MVIKDEEILYSENASINTLIESIALEETGLSHILNAEGDKIQKSLSMDVTIDELLSINKSVSETIQDIALLEMVLLNKLRATMGYNASYTVHHINSTIQIAHISTHVFLKDISNPIKDALVQVCYMQECGGEKIEDVESKLVHSGNTNSYGHLMSSGLKLGVYLVTVTHNDSIVHTQAVPLCEANQTFPVEVVIPEDIPPITSVIPKYVYIEGCIYDKCCQPLPYARIFVNGKQAYSDIKGRFTIENVTAGTKLIVMAYYNSMLIYDQILAVPMTNYYKLCIKTNY